MSETTWSGPPTDNPAARWAIISATVGLILPLAIVTGPVAIYLGSQGRRRAANGGPGRTTATIAIVIGAVTLLGGVGFLLFGVGSNVSGTA